MLSRYNDSFNSIYANPVPLAENYRINTIHLGLIMTLNLMIRLITSPVGLSMYIVCDIANIITNEFLKEVMPFYGILIFVLLLVIYIPDIVLWLPSLG